MLSVYVAVWTLYGVIAKSSQDVHYDMAELVAFAREPALGYENHPPVAALIVKAWFSVFPLADWSYYLLGMTTAAVTLWIVWRLSAFILDERKRMVGLALLTLVPFFNFHALKFNVNTVLMPLWAATTLWLLRSYRTRNLTDATLAGFAAAASIMGKYWSAALLAGLAAAVLIDNRRSLYFKSIAPWMTIAVGAIVLAPHLIWLALHGFAPFSYALAIHGNKAMLPAIMASLSYLAGAAGYVAVPVVLVLLAARPNRAALADTLWPAAPDRRLIALACLGPLLAPALVAPFAGVEIVSVWTMAAWALLPVVLLSSPLLVIPPASATRIMLIAAAFPLLMLAAAPAVALAIHVHGVKSPAAHTRLLAAIVEQEWRATSTRPLRLVGGGGDLAYGVAFYAADEPSAFPDLDPKIALWITPARIARDGIALVCAIDDRICLRRSEALAAQAPAGRSREVEIARKFLGLNGAPARYRIITLPPQP